MRLRYYQKISGGFALVLFMIACALPSALVPDPAPTANPFAPESLGISIAKTAAAAQTQTVSAQPPSLTPTQTRLPTSTLIVAPATQTAFSLITETSAALGIPLETTDPAYAVTAGISGLGASNAGDTGDEVAYTGKPWTCAVRSASPRGGLIQPKAEFYAYWTVYNTGTMPWTANTIDFVYKSGYRHEGKIIQDLSSTVASGRSITLKVLFKAPKSPGIYTAIWTLKVGNNRFCGMMMYFEVQ